MNFNDKVILVTGGGSGIGADAAIHLAKLGGKLCLVGRNEKNLNDVAEVIRASGSSVQPLVIVAHVTNDAERVISEAINHFGKLDVLINNAGIFHRDSVNNLDITQFDDVIDTNLRSVALLTSLAVPHLEQTKGNIVNVSSVAGMRALGGTMSYCVSKAALDQFTKCVALDVAPMGIRVNSINPGMIRTPIFAKAGMSPEQVEMHIETAKTVHPIGRIGEPSDTSAAIAYMASDSASFVTGVLLPVDGGWVAK